MNIVILLAMFLMRFSLKIHENRIFYYHDIPNLMRCFNGFTNATFETAQLNHSVNSLSKSTHWPSISDSIISRSEVMIGEWKQFAYDDMF